MWQEIITYGIIVWALYKLIQSVYEFFFPKKQKIGCSTGCSKSCLLKEQN